MRLFHTTDAAMDVLSAGFRDATGPYGFTGVFLTEVPLDVNDDVVGGDLLLVDLPDDLDMADYEIVHESEGVKFTCGEWCVPASLINERGTVRLPTEQEARAPRHARLDEIVQEDIQRDLDDPPEWFDGGH